MLIGRNTEASKPFRGSAILSSSDPVIHGYFSSSGMRTLMAPAKSPSWAPSFG